MRLSIQRFVMFGALTLLGACSQKKEGQQNSPNPTASPSQATIHLITDCKGLGLLPERVPPLTNLDTKFTMGWSGYGQTSSGELNHDAATFGFFNLQPDHFVRIYDATSLVRVFEWGINDMVAGPVTADMRMGMLVTKSDIGYGKFCATLEDANNNIVSLIGQFELLSQ